MMLHKKIAVIVVCAAVFLCLSGISWALVYSQPENEGALDQLNDAVDDKFLTPEQICDAVMCYIETNHPETAQFMDDLVWAGGREDTGLLGAETYNFESQGWKVTISYPVVANPIYDITANYSVPSGMISIPYAVIWEGTWEKGTVTETNFVFAQ
jgi:hypothetical protein